MKELEVVPSDPVAEIRKKEEEAKVEFMGSLRPKKGHTLFKVCKKTHEISEAEYKTSPAKFNELVNGQPVTRRKVIVEDGFIYISCLNKKNVERKLSRKLDI